LSLFSRIKQVNITGNMRSKLVSINLFLTHPLNHYLKLLFLNSANYFRSFIIIIFEI
jgi:hypothetical protein